MSVWQTPNTSLISTNTGADLPANLNKMEGNVQIALEEDKTFRYSSTYYIFDPFTFSFGRMPEAVISIPAGHRLRIKKFQAFAFVPTANSPDIEWGYEFADGVGGSSTETFTAGSSVDYGASYFSSDPAILRNESAGPKIIFFCPTLFYLEREAYCEVVMQMEPV